MSDDFLIWDEWNNIATLNIFGFGDIGMKSFKKLSEDFQISCIVDNDREKQGYTYEGIHIKSPEEAVPELRRNRTIVCTVGRSYGIISRQLQSFGLLEGRDYCSIESFLAEWYWKNREQNCLLEVHTAITMRCTFQCKNCNMFVPYYKSNVDYDLDSLKQDAGLLFGRIDYLCSFVLLGGEPLLNPELPEMIAYLGENYQKKLGTISVVTNGSILPDIRLIESLKRFHVKVSISDYTGTIAYRKRLDEVIDILKKEKIEYVVRKALRWCDFGFPSRPFSFKTENLRKHMLSCAPVFHGLNDGKFYYCHAAWSAEKSGCYSLCPDDYVKLDEISPEDGKAARRIVKHGCGEIEGGYISLCRICGGCGEDNRNFVTAGVQMAKGDKDA